MPASAYDPKLDEVDSPPSTYLDAGSLSYPSSSLFDGSRTENCQEPDTFHETLNEGDLHFKTKRAVTTRVFCASYECGYALEAAHPRVELPKQRKVLSPYLFIIELVIVGLVRGK